ncbi:hypothetical protein [Hippea maritima]|uniref:Putative cytoplasmic protein n=1 Tax=Hippea maritima (strain ATCC 700847 / DSM 10411 / MH2) TaxID=760142 RepID=F2LV34_HIPMA|nr:hypothetical protein [Hippea maritima]AEA33618.1 putative cytoplasmic protein [Hippea maritima DSM 10411]
MAEMTREEREKFFQTLQERKENLAKQRETRVVFARTRDTEAALAIVQSADRALNLLRRNAGLRFPFEEVARHVEAYKKAVLDMHKTVDEMCKYAGVPYRVPAWVREQLGMSEEDDAEA